MSLGNFNFAAGQNGSATIRTTGTTAYVIADAFRWLKSATAPLAPTNLIATGGNAQVALSWDASTGATSYKVFRAAKGSAYNFASPTATVSATSYMDTGLTNGTTYLYVVRAVNGSGESGSSNEDIAVPHQPAPVAPTNLTATGGDAQIALGWSAVSEATSYKVFRSTTSGNYNLAPPVATVTTTSYADTSVANGTTYFYVVRAVNATGDSANSNESSATPSAPADALNAPTDLSASVSGTTVSLSWTDNSTGESGYKVQRKVGGNGAWSEIFRGTLANQTSYSNTGLSAGTYVYRVLAYKASVANGPTSNEASVTVGGTPMPPAAPINLTATVGNAQVTLAWNAVSGATSYKVFRSTTTGSYNTASPVATVTTTNTTDTGLTNGTTYFYIVRALNADGESANSNEVSATPSLPAPSAPTGLTATAGNAQIALSWNAVSGATSYKVFRSTTSGTYSYTAPLATVTTTTYADVSAANGTTYFYVVRAFNAGGESSNSNEVSATPTAPVPLAPTSLTATGGNAQVALSWSASTGATSYKVFRSTTSGSYTYTTPLTTVTTASYTNTGLTNGTTYFYVVRAGNAGGESGNSNQATATPSAPAPSAPTNLTATGGNAQVTLGWSAVTGATGYKVFRATTSGGYNYATPLATTSTVGYTDASATNGTTYFYVVRAVNAGGESANSNQVSATPNVPAPAAPTNLVATGGNAQVALAWSASAGATGYKVFRTTTSDTYNYTAALATVTTATYTDASAANGTTYFYVVRATNAGGESANSNQASATPSAPAPSAPTNLTATAGNAQIALAWNAVSGATSYQVFRATTSGTYNYASPIATVTAPSATNRGLTNGTTYFYVVRAVNAAGNSGNSNEASGTPQGDPTNAVRQLDLQIQALTSPSGAYVGEDVYYPDEQTSTFSIPDHTKATFALTVKNNGNVSDWFRLSGRGDTPGWSVRYFDSLSGGSDISAQIKGNNYVANLSVGESRTFRVEVTPDASVAQNASKDVPISVVSENDSAGAFDRVLARAVQAGAAPPPPAPTYRVDGAVRLGSETPYLGENVYAASAGSQTKNGTASSSAAAVYHWKVTNTGSVADSFQLKLPAANPNWTVRLYDALDGGTDITTAAQNSSGYTTAILAPQRSLSLRLQVQPQSGTTGALNTTLTATSAGDTSGNTKDVVAANTTVGSATARPSATFTGATRASAGGIDNALHKLTLTLHATTSSGANLANTPLTLSFEDNVGHNYGTSSAPDVPRRAKIYDPGDVNNRWKETLTLTTNANGDISVTVLSSDVVSQLRLIARWTSAGQTSTIGGVLCDFAAVTSKRGFPDPVVGAYNGWENDDNGWSCDFSALEEQGQTVQGKLFLKFLNPSGNYQIVENHSVNIKLQSVTLTDGTSIYDQDEIPLYVKFVDSSGVEQTQLQVLTDAGGIANFKLKATVATRQIGSVKFNAQNRSQWRD